MRKKKKKARNVNNKMKGITENGEKYIAVED